jgi:putative pyridoxal-dependent aspartate 1-decarboxylase
VTPYSFAPAGEGRRLRPAAARVLPLFAPPLGAAAASEAAADARVDAMAREFLGSRRIRGGRPYDDVAAAFGDVRLPERGDPEAFWEHLARHVVPGAMNVASPRFIGHMTTALPYFVRPLARLVTTLNQNVVKLETARALSAVERQVTATVHRLVYGGSDAFYAEHVQARESTLGMVCSGGTVANLTALWCARNAALPPVHGEGGAEREGLMDALARHGWRRAVIVGSSLMHYSLEKTADVLGIGSGGLVRVPVDARHRVDPRAVRETLARCRAEGSLVVALVGVAGSTDAGSVDPLAELAAAARDAGVHFHVDAAWGGPVMFSARHQHLLRGIEQADSVTLDGHKQLYLPMGVGMVLLRDPALAQVVEKSARYIVRRGSADLGRRALEGSRPASSLFVHAALSILGREGYEFLIDEGIRKARYMANLLAARPEFELLARPQTNILLYRVLPPHLRGAGALTAAQEAEADDFNVRLQRAQRRAGRTFVSRTSLPCPRTGAQRVALRAVLANPLTRESDVLAVLADQLQIAETLNGAPRAGRRPVRAALESVPA